MPPAGNEYAADQLKTQGNLHFKNGEYDQAEQLYSQAIQKNSKNPLLFTNRANARLKLERWDGVINDCLASIELMSENMKAYFYLGTSTVLHQPSGLAHLSSQQTCSTGTDSNQPSQRGLEQCATSI